MFTQVGKTLEIKMEIKKSEIIVKESQCCITDAFRYYFRSVLILQGDVKSDLTFTLDSYHKKRNSPIV